MRKIAFSELKQGELTDHEYFTIDGEKLISIGVRLTQRHLDALARRNVQILYVQDNTDDELHQILSKEFAQLGELQFDDSRTPVSPIASRAESDMTLPGFAEIKSGKDGLIQLIKSQRGIDLDTRLKDGKSPDRPSGPALRDSASQMVATARDEEYKSDKLILYSDALRQTKVILNSLAQGQAVDGHGVRTIIDNFVRTFVTDRDILLNLASIKHDSEDHIYHHSLDVCLLAINIAASSGYSQQQVVEIGIGALLHDIGMLLCPRELRLKKGRLSEDEWYEIQKHPVLGLHLLEKISHLPESVPYVAYQCHERENGKGYPKQRSTRLIHNYAKVCMVADIYEALSSPRTYREANMPYKAMEMLIKMTRQGLISGEFVKAFLEYTSLFPVGSVVELSNGCIGRVVRSNGTCFSKPVVSVLVDSHGKMLTSDKVYTEDLSVNTSLQIAKAHLAEHTGPDIMRGF